MSAVWVTLEVITDASRTYITMIVVCNTADFDKW